MSAIECDCLRASHEHGTHRMRIVHACPCDPCSTAYAAHNRKRNAAWREEVRQEHVPYGERRRVVELQCRIELPPRQRTTMRDLNGERFRMAYLHYEIAPTGDGTYSRVAFALDSKGEPRRAFMAPGKSKTPWPVELPPPPAWFTDLITLQMGAAA